MTCWPRAARVSSVQWAVSSKNAGSSRHMAEANTDRLRLSFDPALLEIILSASFLLSYSLLFTFHFSLFTALWLPTAHCPLFLERLRKPEMHLCSLQAIDRRRAVEIVDSTGWATLGNQQLRRIEQLPIIDGQGPAE